MNTSKVLLLLLIAGLVTNAALAQTPIFQYKHRAKIVNKNGTPAPTAVLPATKPNVTGVAIPDSVRIRDSIAKAMLPTHEFLDTVNKPKPFSIFKISKYNIDTINAYFYNQGGVSTLESSGLQNFNGVHTDINAEFASFLFGPVRLGVGGSFQTKGDTTRDNAIKSSLQKIISNGGAINLNFLLPIYFTRSRHDQVHFAVFFQSRNSINPGIDSTGTTSYSTNVGYTNQSGFDIHFDVGSNDKKARLYFDIPFFYSASSNNINSQLGLHNFFLAKAEVGAVLGDVMKFNISGPLYSNAAKVQHSPFLISLQFSPSQLIGN